MFSRAQVSFFFSFWASWVIIDISNFMRRFTIWNKILDIVV